MQQTELYYILVVPTISSPSLTSLIPSSSGRFGPGLYLTAKEAAYAIARYKQSQNRNEGLVVFKLDVNLGLCKDNGYSNDIAGNWASYYDSCTGIHPAWAGGGPFQEWVVKDANQIRIVEMDFFNGTIEGDLIFPGVDAKISGNSRFGGGVFNFRKLILG